MVLLIIALVGYLAKNLDRYDYLFLSAMLLHILAAPYTKVEETF